jgi:hypothetical protein
MKVVETIEHEDGSATITFDLTEEEREFLLQYGLTELIKNGVEQMKNNFTIVVNEGE